MPQNIRSNTAKNGFMKKILKNNPQKMHFFSFALDLYIVKYVPIERLWYINKAQHLCFNLQPVASSYDNY